MKITVAGTGYVGLSIAVLLAQHHTVTALDIVPEKVACINEKKSPIVDAEMEDYLANKPLQLHATTDQKAAYTGADIIVISTPTNYDPKLNYFDTSSVEAALGMALQYAPDATIVIKSTVPVGYTRSLQERAGHRNILFSPEFLREGHALYDNLHPSRIVVGCDDSDPEMLRRAREFAGLLAEGALDENVPALFPGLTEAEAIKLFANTYLALRVSYFNELIPMPRCTACAPAILLRVSAWTRASATFTTTRALVTADTACPKIPSSCWPTMPMCRKR